MTPKELKARTEEFSKSIITFCAPLLDGVRTRDMARQLLRSGTAVDANYGSAQRGRSHDEFTARLGIVFDESSEAKGWLDLMQRSALIGETEAFRSLQRESAELTRIFAVSYRTARAKQATKRAEKMKQLRVKSTPR
ncbi:MAG TPA: four helix bundle protein [Vicinamibacterales bacterium]|nr:four helix bundle protein [Vicinamibacterales bacterium]